MWQGRYSRYIKAAGFILVFLLIFSCAKQTEKGKVTRDGRREILTPIPSKRSSTPEYNATQRLVERGKREISHNRFEKATQTLEAAINIEPSNGEAYFWLAKANLMLGDSENAMQLLDRALVYLSNDEWIKKAEDLHNEIEDNEGY